MATPTDGHRIGFARTPQVLDWVDRAGIPHVTLWVLSTENLRRDPAEVEVVMDVLCETVRRLALQERWRVRHLGTTDGLSERLKRILALAEEHTDRPARMTVNLAIGYGGRREIVTAVRAALAHTIQHGATAAEAAEHLTPEQITRQIGNGRPEPDLIIRTSGELRSSGFLLWSAADARWWFTPTLWPDFDRRHLRRALIHYRKAQQR
ncbi:polyprenyl diphosphate synthase [Kitasatospora sp. NPDC056184]|uniref:polyprenyl diphosphate synthase n=1 Tax=Kitasatospora sp. NPDC056184 TaxID=3345738 RepID=UPI0035D5F171